MRIQKILIAGFIASTLTTGFTSSASAAQERDLPAGVSAYAITDDGGELVTVDVRTGFMAKVDTVTPTDHSVKNWGSGAAYIPSTGYVYWIDNNKNQLRSTKVSSGISSVIGTLNITGISLANIYNPVLTTGPDESVWIFYATTSIPNKAYFGQLNLTTAHVESSIDIKGIYEPQVITNLWDIYSFAYNPANQKWYIASVSSHNPLWSFNSNGTVSDSVTAGTDSGINGMAFDSNGILWGNSYYLTSQTLESYSVPSDLQKTPNTTYVGYTIFFVGPIPSVNAAVSKSQEQTAAEARVAREAVVTKARNEAVTSLTTGGPLTEQMLLAADLVGVTDKNIGAINAEISSIPSGADKDFATIAKVVLKYATVDKISTGGFYSSDLTAIGLIAPDSKQKTSAVVALKRLPADQIDSYVKIQAVIAAVEKKAAERSSRLASIKSRIAGVSAR